MIDRNYILNLVKSKDVTIDEFNYDKLTAPPIAAFFTPYDLQRLTEIATSLRYSSKPQLKYQEIDKIMKSRGFSKLSAGTNRVVYKCNELDTIVCKCAYDAIGMSDNPREFINQNYLKPFCTKIFEVSPTGVLAFAERVNPITNREEFLSIAEDVYTLITEFILDGTIVMDDIGTKYFMNYGVRKGVGPVTLDFSFLYHLDGNKLYCNRPEPQSETGYCGGELDYDDGYNNIVCKKCGAIYRAKDLELKIKSNTIVTKSYKGEFNKMKVKLSGGNKNYNITTEIKTIEVEEPKQFNEEETVYTEKKKNVHVSLGKRTDEPQVKITNNKKEDNTPIVTSKVEEPKVVEEVKKEEEVVVKPAEEIKAVEVKQPLTSPILSSPIKVTNYEKDDNDIIRDIIYDAAKTISGVQLKGLATKEYLMSALNHIKFLIDTMRSTDGWDVSHEDELLNKISLASDNIKTDINQDDAGVVHSEITYEDDNSIYVLHSQDFIVTAEPIDKDNENNEEPAAKEMDVEEVNNDNENNAENTIVEDTNEDDPYEGYELVDEEEFYDEEKEIVGYVPFSAKVIDIATKVPGEENKNVIVIDDGNGGFLTVGDGSRYLVIDRVNGIDTNEASIVSKNFVDNVLKEVEEKSTELTADTFKESEVSTVNGVPTEEK